ncbi:hypothetical protein MBGDF03_00636 [Thermoplasmatales archaeon SCGC AB-540-F20]|nr:hypothetical protein MBGDF03_00636 [Thermoplasmatales archaeon SCGC AB-540-F20]
MDIIWSILIIVAGVLLLTCGLTKSNFIICRLLRHRSKILLGETGANVLHIISGLIIIILGVMSYLGYLW